MYVCTIDHKIQIPSCFLITHIEDKISGLDTMYLKTLVAKANLPIKDSQKQAMTKVEIFNILDIFLVFSSYS